VPLCIIDFLQVGVVADRLDALLQGIISSSQLIMLQPGLQTFVEVHGAD